jgi:hypothetical protein
MRRLVCILAIVFVTLTLWAAEATPRLNVSATTALDISTFMGDVANVSVVPEGMPFDVMGSDVWWKTGNIDDYVGRRIATWSLRTNSTNKQLSITAHPLALETDTTKKINYRLTFGVYFYDEDVDRYVEKKIHIYSNDIASPVVTDLDLNNLPIMASSSQPVRILLVSDNNGAITPYTNADRIGWSAGNYSANVEISITGGV